MYLDEYDEEKVRAVLIKDAVDEAVEEAVENTKQETKKESDIHYVQKMYSSGIDLQTIATISELPLKTVKSILNLS